jgi:hypothetical protein
MRPLPDAFRNRDLRLLGLARSSSTTAEATYLLVLGLSRRRRAERWRSG